MWEEGRNGKKKFTAWGPFPRAVDFATYPVQLGHKS